MEQLQTICPICKGENACTVKTNPYECWCMTIKVEKNIREQLPSSLQCICQQCLQNLIALNESL